MKLMRSQQEWLTFLPQCVAEYGDIVYFNILGIPACLINSPAALQQVLVNDSQNFIKSTDYFALNRVLGQGLLTSEGDVWKKQRRLIQPAFFRERILSYGGIMTESATRLIERWQDGEVRDVHADMMQVTLQIAARSLFSADVDNEARTIGRALTVVLDQVPIIARLSFLPGLGAGARCPPFRARAVRSGRCRLRYHPRAALHRRPPQRSAGRAAADSRRTG